MPWSLPGTSRRASQRYVRAFQAERAALAATIDKLAKGGKPEWRPQATAFDFDTDPEPPDWIIYRTVERGTVVMLSGDTGSAESIVTNAMLPAALNGEAWLGMNTHVDRLTVIDEENPGRLVQARLRALGVTNEHRDRLRYFNREGFAVADGGRSDERLREHLAEFRPDLLIIDTRSWPRARWRTRTATARPCA
jgi:AAA domain